MTSFKAKTLVSSRPYPFKQNKKITSAIASRFKRQEILTHRNSTGYEHAMLTTTSKVLRWSQPSTDPPWISFLANIHIMKLPKKSECCLERVGLDSLFPQLSTKPGWAISLRWWLRRSSFWTLSGCFYFFLFQLFLIIQSLLYPAKRIIHNWKSFYMLWQDEIILHTNSFTAISSLQPHPRVDNIHLISSTVFCRPSDKQKDTIVSISSHINIFGK